MEEVEVVLEEVEQEGETQVFLTKKMKMKVVKTRTTARAAENTQEGVEEVRLTKETYNVTHAVSSDIIHPNAGITKR